MTDPREAVRLAFNVTALTTILSCHTPDIGTVRVWSAGSSAPAFDVCATRVWRTDDWRLAPGGDACPCTIPYRVSFTGKIDVRKAQGTMGDNVRNTIAMLGFRDVAFYTDDMCVTLLRTMEKTAHEFRGVPLLQAFTFHKLDGRVRSDVCRLAALWDRGGYYFDNDLVLLDDSVVRRVAPTTTFATVTTVRWLFDNPPGLFNAFLACAPRHPVVRSALILHARWPKMTVDETRRVTRSTAGPNIGTVLLRDALRSVAGDAAVFECERTGYCGGGVQLFREVALEPEGEYAAPGLCVMCDVTHACNFAVADVPSGDVFLKSRVAAADVPCPTRCAPAAPCVKPRAVPTAVHRPKK